MTNALTLNNETSKPDPAANEPYEVTLHNGVGKATVRNLTVRDMLEEMTDAAKLDMASGDPRIEASGRRFYIIGRALLGELEHPMEGYHEILKTDAAQVGETREQFLQRQLMEAQAENRRLKLGKFEATSNPTDIEVASDSPKQ